MSFLLEGFEQAFALLASGDPQTYSAVEATIIVSSMSIVGSLVLGAPLGFLLGHAEFPGRKALRTVADTLLSLPTVVIGLVVYAFLTRRGPLGELELLFTLPGIAIGQIILGLPVVAAHTAGAVEDMDARLKNTLLTLGASRRDVLLTTMWEARHAILLAGVSAYGRIVSEIGISMMIGGNIKWHTRTITTAISLETGKGEFAMGVALGIVLMIIATAVNLTAVSLKRMARA